MPHDYHISVLIFIPPPNFILMAFIKGSQVIYFLICFFIKTQEQGEAHDLSFLFFFLGPSLPLNSVSLHPPGAHFPCERR